MTKKINLIRVSSLAIFITAFVSMSLSANACTNFDNHKKKVEICHFQKNGFPKTITVNKADVFKYLAHGDHIGKCKKDDYEHNHKVLICHIPYGNQEMAHEIIVRKFALKAHLAHGDTIGECPDNTPICGDGSLTSDEQCDDGNTINNDGCSAICKTEICGDSIKQSAEECDDGNNSNNDGCTSECKAEICGDGIKQITEECDEGILNGIPNHCDLTCSGLTLPVCGNSIIETDEQCDDGNLTNGDGCDSACKTEEILPLTFAKSELTAVTKNGVQTGEAILSFGKDIYGKILVTCADWTSCNVTVSHTSGAILLDFEPTFDVEELSDEQCDISGLCTQQTSFIMPANPDPSVLDSLSISLTFMDALFINAGQTTISFAPDRDLIDVASFVAVTDSEGNPMSATGQAQASVNSSATDINYATSANGASASTSASSVITINGSDAFSSSKSVADGFESISSVIDTISAENSASVNHNVTSSGTGASANSTCAITSQSNGQSTATLDGLSQDGMNTADIVNHSETLIDPNATVTVTANCGDVQF